MLDKNKIRNLFYNLPLPQHQSIPDQPGKRLRRSYIRLRKVVAPVPLQHTFNSLPRQAVIRPADVRSHSSHHRIPPLFFPVPQTQISPPAFYRLP